VFFGGNIFTNFVGTKKVSPNISNPQNLSIHQRPSLPFEQLSTTLALTKLEALGVGAVGALFGPQLVVYGVPYHP